MKTELHLDFDNAKWIVDRCALASVDIGVPVSVAVLDAAGHLLLLARFDGASFQSPEIARRKALTSVMTKSSSADVEAVTLSRLTFANIDDGRLPIQGGLPIFSGNRLVGAVGVSGGTSEQDEAIARAGIEGIEVDQLR